jgi:hypothetical protein
VTRRRRRGRERKIRRRRIGFLETDYEYRAIENLSIVIKHCHRQ